MKGRILKISGALALVLALLVPCREAPAQATVSGGVSVSGGVTVSTHSPPVVVVPAPPVVVAPAPPTAVVVVTEQPKPKPPPKVVVKTPPLRPAFEKQVGFGLRVSGALHGHEEMHDKGMGGAGLLLRLRLLPHFATEIGIDAYGGQGYAGEKRAEVPFSLGFMWMPMYYLTRVQFYTIGGLGGAWAHVGEDPYVDKPFYMGGFLGLGFEVKLGIKRRVALFTDIRGFIRKRLNDRPSDPMIPTGGSCRDDGMGGIECTDWEGGFTMSLGLVVYF
jgi:hypothetical protein